MTTDDKSQEKDENAAAAARMAPCPLCAELPVRPKTWQAWGEEERAAWLEQQAVTERANALAAQLQATLSKEQRVIFFEMDSLEGKARTLEMDIVRARLVRYLPQYADLIDFATEGYEACPEGSAHQLLVPMHGG